MRCQREDCSCGTVGLRTKKTVGSTVTNYSLHGANIVYLTRGSDTLHFYYDAQGKPAMALGLSRGL